MATCSFKQQQDARSASSANTVSVVVPVLNEVENLPTFLSEMDRALNPIKSVVDEVVFVDDGSTDGTLELLFSVSKNRRDSYSIKVVERKEVLGTVDAQLCGSKNANNPLIITMDGDGQHSPALIPKMISAWSDDLDVIVASRYVRGGKRSWGPQRELISRSASLVAYLLIPNARQLSDPMSGYFMLRKSLLENLLSYKKHYKLLLYVAASSKNLRIREISYTMEERRGGKSKVATLRSGFVTKYLVEVFRYYLITRRKGL